MNSNQAEYEQQPAQASGRLVGDRYRVHDLLGSGRLGEIYSATDEGGREPGGDVAIQILSNSIGQDDTAVARLKSGYTLLREKAHPNIVPYLDLGHDDRFRYVVMSLLDGAAMRTIIDHAQWLPPDEVAPVVRGLGGALEFLHANSIPHGALTATNVFVTGKLDIRLLDVVPLEAPASAREGLFADDVHALACLTYEMLKGKHPFDHRTRAEAREARIVPAQIEALPETQWNALCRAMTFDEQRRTRTVSEFLREFGIDGTERLRPEKERQASVPTGRKKTVRQAPSPGGAASTTPSNPGKLARESISVERDEQRARRPRRLRPALLFAVLLVVGAWFWFGQPRDDVAVLVDRLESQLGQEPTSMSEVDPGAPPVEAVDAPVTVIAGETLPGGVQADAGDAGDAGDASASADVSIEESPAAASETAVASIGDPAPTEAGANAATAQPPVGFDLAVVTVSERDTVARLAVSASSPPATAYWWTRDHDAVADEDYIAVDTQMIVIGEGEPSATVLVPLVNDGVPEGIEDFFVHLGLVDADSGRLVPVDTIRVDIVDDD